MNSQPTSNIDELLGLNNQQSETNSSENDLDLIENTASASEDTAEKGWADDVKKRLIFAAIICAVPVTVFMVFYGTALDLKQAFSKKSQEPEAISVEKVETEDPLLAENENLKGTIAIGEQRLALESIDRRQADTEIKLEATESLELPVVPDTPAPQPISQLAPPTIQRSYDPPTRSISSTRSTAPTVSKAAKSEIKYDTMAIWTQLSQAGSYGNGAINVSSLATKPVVSIKDRLTNPGQKLPPIVASANSTQAELTTNEAKFLEALQNSKAPATKVTPQNSGSKIAMAQQIEARLITAINWIGNEQDRKQRSLIKLSEPLLNNAGEVQVPESTVLVYEISGVDGGIILGDAVAIIQDEQEIKLPPNALSILNHKGDLLTANYKEVKNGSGNSHLLDFAYGAAKQTADLITAPDSSFSQISGYGQTQSSNYDNKNYPGAIVSGGLEQLLEGKTSELNRRRSVAPISNFWQLKQDSKLMIQVNYPFAI